MTGAQKRSMIREVCPRRRSHWPMVSSGWLLCRPGPCQPGQGPEGLPALARREVPLAEQPGQQVQRGRQPAGGRQVAADTVGTEEMQCPVALEQSPRPMRRQKSSRLVQQPIATCWQVSTSWPLAESRKEAARPPRHAACSNSSTRQPCSAVAAAAPSPANPPPTTATVGLLRCDVIRAVAQWVISVRTLAGATGSSGRQSAISSPR